MNTIPSVKETVLDNGITIISEYIPKVRSAAVGLMVGTGSSSESENNLGVSHFIEHMCFKGTQRRSAFQIAKELDEIGGRINAFTGKDMTMFFAVVLDRHIDLAIDVLSDLYLNSSFDAKDVKMEQGVILEEISMYEDSPDELIHDLFAETVLLGHPAAWPTLGTHKTVKSLTREDLLGYRKKHYVPDNLIISVAGNIRHDAVVSLISNYFGKTKGKKHRPVHVHPKMEGQKKLKRKKIEQVHMCLGGKAVSQLDPDRYAFTILDNILGGSMSSRLFQEVREKRGLVYSIFSTVTPFRDFGIYYIYAGTSKENIKKVIDIVLSELSNIKKVGITKDELMRAKEHLKGTLVLGLEATSSRMSFIARSQFFYGKVITIDEIFKSIDKITHDDILRLANKYFLEKYLSLVVIGDYSGLPQIDLKL
ncbi:MAG: insulinase family protein [Candidatus Saganbacteria bacterium]|nr:insulinase family protein [Candidatus Saganbacteria bacterium]